MLKLINKKNNIFIYILILISVLLYVFTLRGIYGNPNGNMIKNNLDQATRPFELSPERGRYILSMSLADNKSFSLSQTLADAAYPDVGYYQGRFYINFAPGISLISLPFYLIGKYFNLSQMFSFFSISIFALLNIFLLFKKSKIRQTTKPVPAPVKTENIKSFLVNRIVIYIYFAVLFPLLLVVVRI